jgi:hypothetical protein
MGIRFTAFAVRKNAKRELSFFLTAARAAGQSPKGSKAVNPPVKPETLPKSDLSLPQPSSFFGKWPNFSKKQEKKAKHKALRHCKKFTSPIPKHMSPPGLLHNSGEGKSIH